MNPGLFTCLRSSGCGTVPASGLVHATQELVRLVCEAGGDPIPEDLWPVLVERREAKSSK